MNTVLICVIDGLQPAQVIPERMPNLSRFATDGVVCDNHHSVFPTVTRVNAVSMLTGRYPGGHGLAGNTLVIRDYDPTRSFKAMRPELTDVIERTGGLLLAPHLADILGAHGREFFAIGIGSNGNSFLQNPNAGVNGGATLHPEFSNPSGLYEQVVARFGPWPEKDRPDEHRLAHAVQILTEHVLPERLPTVALIWCSEPDSSQHYAGVGSKLAERALVVADRQFSRLIEWLDQTGSLNETDVMVLSDHGYTTASGMVDVEHRVLEAGFSKPGVPGGVAVCSNGGSVLFYVHEKNRQVADRLASWLMEHPWCGPIVASKAMDDIPGTLPAGLVGLEGQRTPDLTLSFTWSSDINKDGYAGLAFSTDKPTGMGDHGSISKHTMRNVLIARGPSFKRGVVLNNPTGNVDVAPTILRVLGLNGGDDMDGRVIEEALEGGPDLGSVVWSTDTYNAERTVEGGVYRQRITVSRAGTTVYVNEGRASREDS